MGRADDADEPTDHDVPGRIDWPSCSGSLRAAMRTRVADGAKWAAGAVARRTLIAQKEKEKAGSTA